MKSDKFYLVYIRECLERIREFTEAGKDAFMGSHLIRDAVLRNLHTLTESTLRLSDGLKNSYPAQDKKKGADRGVDGVIYFKDDAGGAHKKIIVQVKSGAVGSPHIRDLKGVLDREKAAIGALITLKPPTKAMREEAAAADFYVPEQFPESRFPRLQILTIADLFAGKKLDYPQWAAHETFKKAARRRKGPSDEERQGELL